MAKHEPARGPGPCKLAAGRDWSLRLRTEFLAGFAGWACGGLGQTRDGLNVYHGTRGDPQSRSLPALTVREMAIGKPISSSSHGERNGLSSSLIRHKNFDPRKQLLHACSSSSRLIHVDSLLCFFLFLSFWATIQELWAFWSCWWTSTRYISTIVGNMSHVNDNSI